MVDAQAALDLVKLKVAKGPAYGTVTQHEEQGDRLMDVLHAHNRRCTLIDRTDMLNRHVTGVPHPTAFCPLSTLHVGCIAS